MKKLIYVALCASLAISSAVALSEETIKTSPKQGEKTKFRMEMDIEGTNVVAMLSNTILEVKKDGSFVMRESLDSIAIVVNGQEMDLGITNSVKATYSPLGELVDYVVEAGEMEGSQRWQQGMIVLYPEKPVSPGDTWKRTVKADSEKGTVASETIYKFVGNETIAGVECWKIEYTFSEKGVELPVTITATLWLDKKDGSMIQGHYSMKNVEFQPGMPMNATAKTKRIN